MDEKQKKHAAHIFALLQAHYPNAHMILEWSNPFELLMAIILSAQCTDVMVNKVTKVFFPESKQENPSLSRYYHQYAFLSLPEDQKRQLVNVAFNNPEAIEKAIHATGFFRNKAKHLQEAAKKILDTFQGKLPRTIAELTTIPGVGRKTANVFLGNAYNIVEGIAVDTHVKKMALLFGFTTHTDPQKIEQDLMQLFPHDQWFRLTYLLIEHGRNRRKKKQDRYICDIPGCPLCTAG